MSNLIDIKKILADHEKRIKKLEGGPSSRINKTNKASKISISGLILDLKSKNFFKKPRFRDEIVKKLAQDGHNYNPSSLNWTLQDLVRKRKLGRVGEQRKWKYVER